MVPVVDVGKFVAILVFLMLVLFGRRDGDFLRLLVKVVILEGVLLVVLVLILVVMSGVVFVSVGVGLELFLLVVMSLLLGVNRVLSVERKVVGLVRCKALHWSGNILIDSLVELRTPEVLFELLLLLGNVQLGFIVIRILGLM